VGWSVAGREPNGHAGSGAEISIRPHRADRDHDLAWLVTLPLTGALNEQANEVSFATDNADAAHEALRARGVDADAEVPRLGEGVPAMFTFRDQDGNRD
jgi:hypothetical protein